MMNFNTLQGFLNAQKEQTLPFLKKRGKFVEFSEDDGFLYHLELKTPTEQQLKEFSENEREFVSAVTTRLPFGKSVHKMLLSMKNGAIAILDVQH